VVAVEPAAKAQGRPSSGGKSRPGSAATAAAAAAAASAPAPAPQPAFQIKPRVANSALVFGLPHARIVFG